MKILIIHQSKIKTKYKALGDYIISIFSNVDVLEFELHSDTVENNKIFIKYCDLILCCIPESEISTVLNTVQTILRSAGISNKKPILIASFTERENSANYYLSDKFIKEHHIIDCFGIKENSFDFNKKCITQTSENIKIIRRINSMKQTHFKSEYPFDGFTCGINPDRDYCGDAIEY
ncbi:MAG: hypothetical protein ACPG6V_04030 [Flavobacteriales bacterium]